MKLMSVLSLLAVLGLLSARAEEAAPAATPPEENPMVILKTTKGDIQVELYPDKAPDTVANFLKYVDDGFYNGTIFHRVIGNFMIQGGGFTKDMQQKPTRAPVKNEAANGLKNTRGTLAMARTGDPHSATAQFFINVVDNGFLNHTSPDPRGYGYCVFGKVVSGLDVVDAIRGVATGNRGMFQDVPVESVEIISATRAPAN
jgi:peptidyl-prolyl cis-trans isomerase B (cyclophilin B)